MPHGDCLMDAMSYVSNKHCFSGPTKIMCKARDFSPTSSSPSIQFAKICSLQYCVVTLAFRFSPSSIGKLGFTFPFREMAMAGRIRSIIPVFNQILKSESRTQRPALQRALLCPTTANFEVIINDFSFLFSVFSISIPCFPTALSCICALISLMSV